MTDITTDHRQHRPFPRAVKQPPEPSPTVEHDRERTPTWLEFIADGLSRLTYGEMKEFAKGVLGPNATSEQIIEFADKVHSWADGARTPQ
jgi:hypothetical protein